jgi:Concanavalin A-like lectin/glucanases superfamily
MATVTGLTAERMLEIEAASVVDGDIVDGELILTKHDGSQVNAGSVIGPPGPVGPVGSDLEVITEQTIWDVGMPGQIRAGRDLELMDFEHLGLDAPLGLWNLSNNYNDESGNGRTLINKGGSFFVPGIEGAASSAMQFAGSTSQGLYIPDGGTSDPFRIRTGSISAWVRTAKQGVLQTIVSKRLAGAAGQYGYWLRISTANVISFGVSSTGSNVIEIPGISRICDDRWHYVVGTFDGTLMELYVDGVLEASKLNASLIWPSTGPFNIGAFGADASTDAGEPHFGRIDAVFVTPEILTEARIRNLYCARVPHTLGEVPSRASIAVYPSCKGASLLVTDFPVAPLRLYNFSGGSLGNEGSDGSGNLVPTGGPAAVAGVDGTKNNALNFAGAQRLNGTDQSPDLPNGTETVSYGCWLKTGNATATMYIIQWGATNSVNDAKIYVQTGRLFFGSGADLKDSTVFIADGDWHFIAVVHDNSEPVGIKRKLYLDGRLIFQSNVLNSITLGGAGKFAIGQSITNTNPLTGQVDTVFVTDEALTLEEITQLFSKTLHEHMPSPKNVGDHIEAMADDHLLVAFDTLDISNRISVKVAA